MVVNAFKAALASREAQAGLWLSLADLFTAPAPGGNTSPDY